MFGIVDAEPVFSFTGGSFTGQVINTDPAAWPVELASVMIEGKAATDFDTTFFDLQRVAIDYTGACKSVQRAPQGINMKRLLLVQLVRCQQLARAEMGPPRLKFLL